MYYCDSNIIRNVVSLTGYIILDCDVMDLLLKADLYLRLSLSIVFSNVYHEFILDFKGCDFSLMVLSPHEVTETGYASYM